MQFTPTSHFIPNIQSCILGIVSERVVLHIVGAHKNAYNILMPSSCPLIILYSLIDIRHQTLPNDGVIILMHNIGGN